MEEEEIELGPALRAPEKGLMRARLPEHLLEGESLPGTADFGRNLAGAEGRSASTRSSGKRSGRVWISSRTTRPESPSSASCGFWRRS